MSERACQLCGKPLSRIRVGGGEEFCSREHRTQYRLRRGMDRLQEANKVASVMRRRENPKPITVSPVAQMVWRGYFQSMPGVSQAVQAPRRTKPIRQIPGLPAAGCVSPPPAGDQRLSERRRAESQFKPRVAQNVALPRIRVRTGCGLPQAQVVLPPATAPTREAPRRAENLLGKASTRKVVPPKAAALRARSDGAASSAFRAVPIGAQQGMLLRVSRAVGFRLPARAIPSFDRGGPAPGTLQWPEFLGNGRAAYAAALARESEAMQVPLPRRTLEVDCPWRPGPQEYPGVRPPEAIRTELSARDSGPAVRGSAVQWSLSGNVVRGPERSRAEIGGAELSRVFRPLALETVVAAPIAAQRVSVVPFGSGDITFGYPEEEHSIQ